MQVGVEQARNKVAAANRTLVAAVRRQRLLARQASVAQARVGEAQLLSTRLALDKNAYEADSRHFAAAQQVKALRKRLSKAEKALSAAQANAFSSSFAPGAASLVSAPIYNGDHVFPVGVGTEHVSVGHGHHDYPAADIAAPAGAPLYALALGVVDRAWHMPAGNWWHRLHTAYRGPGAAGRHLSYLEPKVQPGALPPRWPRLASSGQRVIRPARISISSFSRRLPIRRQRRGSRASPVEPSPGQDAPTPTLTTAPVFTVVEAEPAADDVVTFTLQS